MSILSTAKGSCLCGAVKISTNSLNPKIGACHCGMCRKWGGGAYLAVECEDDVDFIGAENIGIYQSSAWAERGFCQTCGTHLFYKYKENSHHYIPAGVFDDALGLTLEQQIFIDKKPEYYSFANQTKNLTEADVLAQLAPPPSE